MALEPDGATADSLTEDERRALRGSKFAPLPAPPSSSRSNPRLAHPGGPVKTNKAAALAKFLERKLQQPDGLKSINPDLVELAVKKAKETCRPLEEMCIMLHLLRIHSRVLGMTTMKLQ